MKPPSIREKIEGCITAFCNYDERMVLPYQTDEIFLENMSNAILSLFEEEIKGMKKGKPPTIFRKKSGIADWLNDGYQLALSDFLARLRKGGK